ncbi:hypothetical protein, partial [Fodinicola feengrottensis]|uniref:hypothetical protein n=1 Tax=Fodinicola feengrottensis TaxID=435914 RepID=UPI0024418A09
MKSSGVASYVMHGSGGSRGAGPNPAYDLDALRFLCTAREIESDRNGLGADFSYAPRLGWTAISGS